MTNGEFSDTIKSAAPDMALILTQSWCPQWTFLKKNLDSFSRQNPQAHPDLRIFYFVYDLSPLFQDFLSFKESVFGNNLIPYIRYYRGGVFTEDSNYVTVDGFLARFD